VSGASSASSASVEKKKQKKRKRKKKKVLAVGARVWRILGLIGTCDVWLVSMRHWNPLRASGDAFDIVNKYEAILKNQRHYQKINVMSSILPWTTCLRLLKQQVVLLCQ